MSVTSAVKKAFLKEVGRMDLNSLFLYSSGKSPEVAKAIIDTGLVTDEELFEALHLAVEHTARGDYNFLTTQRPTGISHPDHLQSPEYFAEAIHLGVFTPEELSRLDFDHGENPTIFADGYRNKNLYADLKTKLTTPLSRRSIPDTSVLEDHCAEAH